MLTDSKPGVPQTRKIVIALTTFQQVHARGRQNNAEYIAKYLFYVGKSKSRRRAQNLTGVGFNSLQMLTAAETLRVDLVNILRA